MLDKIRHTLTSLSRAEKKVAQSVLSAPEACVESSIQKLAMQSGVSEPTVVRFCHAIGCQGYHEFKLKLARSIATRDKYFFRDVSVSDDPKQLSDKIIDSTVASMLYTREQLDHQQMANAIQKYCDCSRVEFYGSGGSGLVAEDAQMKFFRLGKPAVAYTDPHIQQASAVLLDAGCLAIAISYTGLNLDLLNTVACASRSGATVIAVTRTGSALSKVADVVLNVDLVEDSDVFSPLKSRLAQMVVLDILAVGVALRGGEQLVERLALASDAIAGKFTAQ